MFLAAEITELEYVQQELEQKKGQWPDIAEGAKVHYTTVVRIGNKRAKNPGSNTIRKLVAYLKARA